MLKKTRHMLKNTEFMTCSDSSGNERGFEDPSIIPQCSRRLTSRIRAPEKPSLTRSETRILNVNGVLYSESALTSRVRGGLEGKWMQEVMAHGGNYEPPGANVLLGAVEKTDE
jgi:hypothetical protein